MTRSPTQTVRAWCKVSTSMPPRSVLKLRHLSRLPLLQDGSQDVSSTFRPIPFRFQRCACRLPTVEDAAKTKDTSPSTVCCPVYFYLALGHRSWLIPGSYTHTRVGGQRQWSGLMGEMFSCHATCRRQYRTRGCHVCTKVVKARNKTLSQIPMVATALRARDAAKDKYTSTGRQKRHCLRLFLNMRPD